MDMEKHFSEDTSSAYEAQKTAHWISQGPVIFQVARTMVKSGLLQAVSDAAEQGLTVEQAARACNLPAYGVQVLFESSLTMGILLRREGRFLCSKAGWFLLNDEMVKVDMDFNHDVNYIGMFRLEDAIREGKPAGLEHFGKWKTIYEALPHLPETVRKSWFAFDHYYIVTTRSPRHWRYCSAKEAAISSMWEAIQDASLCRRWPATPPCRLR